MNRLIPLVLSAALLPWSAQGRADTPKPARAEPPPPPTLEDKGIYADSSAKGFDGGNTAPAAEPAASPTPDATQAPDKPDTRLVRDKPAREQAAVKERIAASDVTVRQEGKDTVEEYRQHGKVWMIKIVPPDGPNRIYMDSTGTGRLNRDPKLGPIDPVYFTIYEWN